MILGPDFSAFVEYCEREGVRYLIVGGFAVGVHGHVRYTKDLDVWIEPTRANTAILLRVLEEFEFGSLGLSERDFLEPGNVIQLGYPPNRLDLLTQPTGVTFADCWPGYVVNRRRDRVERPNPVPRSGPSTQYSRALQKAKDFRRVISG